MKLLTNLIFEPKGKHDPALAYNIKDTVMSADGSKVYFALQDVPENTPLTDEDFWKLQIDLSGSKSAMDEALACFSDYAKIVGTCVKGETAKASGNPVTFLPDAGSLLQPVTVLDVQQQGSGDPYPMGGGRNLMCPFDSAEINGISFAVAENGEITLNGTATANVTYVKWGVTLPVGTYTLSLNNSEVIGTSSENTVHVVARDVASNWLLHVYSYEKNVPMTRTLSSEIDHVYIAVPSGVTLNNFKIAIQLEEGSAATEYAPPSNIRPIIGYDKLDLGVAGKNLFNLNQTYDYFVDSIITGDVITTTFRSNGSLCIKEGDVHPAGAYTLTIVPVSGFERFVAWLYYADNGEEKEIFRFNSTNLSAAFIADRPFKIGFNGIYGNPDHVCSYKVQLEVGSVPSTYESHQGKLHTVQIGQTVYGGRFDWLTGKLVTEWAVKTLTGTEEYGAPSSWANKFAYYCAGFFTDAVSVDGYETVAEIVCSHAPISTPASIGATYELAMAQGSGNWLYVCLGTYETADAFKAFLAAQHAAGTPVQIAYKLATPIEIQLTPHIISAADPEQTNTLYGDGSIDVEYVKPLHVSIEERVAAAVAAAMNTEGE